MEACKAAEWPPLAGDEKIDGIDVGLGNRFKGPPSSIGKVHYEGLKGLFDDFSCDLISF